MYVGYAGAPSAAFNEVIITRLQPGEKSNTQTSAGIAPFNEKTQTRKIYNLREQISKRRMEICWIPQTRQTQTLVNGGAFEIHHSLSSMLYTA